jgi:hypothetical protein
MDIIYKWSITSLDKLDVMQIENKNDGEEASVFENVVTCVKFIYTGTIDSGENKGLESYFNGVCPLPIPVAENFIAYSDLKESDLIEEVKKLHSTSHMNQIIEKSLKAKINPVVAVDVLPWNQETTE